MIAVERIVEGPQRVKPEVPIATGEHVEAIMREKIEDVVAYVSKSFRAKAHYGHDLITLRSQDFSEVNKMVDARPQTYKIHRQRGQEIVMDLMKSWGLDESRYSEHAGEHYLFGEGDYEIRKYPSRIKGMHFERLRAYYRDSGKIFEVKWAVIPNVAMFKFNPIEALAKRK